MLVSTTLTNSTKIIRVADAAAAGQTTVTSSAVDTLGFGACTFVVAFGAITAGGVQSVKAQQSSNNGSDSYADLAGTSIPVADDQDGKLVTLEIVNPRERYLKCAVPRATQNSAIDGIFAILSQPIAQPTSTDASVVNAKIHHSPAEGTA